MTVRAGEVFRFLGPNGWHRPARVAGLTLAGPALAAAGALLLDRRDVL